MCIVRLGAGRSGVQILWEELMLLFDAIRQPSRCQANYRLWESSPQCYYNILFIKKLQAIYLMLYKQRYKNRKNQKV